MQLISWTDGEWMLSYATIVPCHMLKGHVPGDTMGMDPPFSCENQPGVLTAYEAVCGCSAHL